MTYYIKSNTLNLIPDAIASRKRMIIIWLFGFLYNCLYPFNSNNSIKIEVIIIAGKVLTGIVLLFFLRSRIISGIIVINKTANSIDITEEFINIKTFPVYLFIYQIKSRELHFKRKLYDIKQRPYPIIREHYPIKDMLIIIEDKIEAYIMVDFFNRELEELLKTDA